MNFVCVGDTTLVPRFVFGIAVEGPVPLCVSRSGLRHYAETGSVSQPVPSLNVKLNPKDLVTYTTAARMRGVSVQAISRLVRRGKLKLIEIDGHKFVFREEVQMYRPSVGGRPAKRTAKASGTRTSRSLKSN
jgi:hypothetical protein